MFLDVAKAFDKVWHKGLILKLNNYYQKQYVILLASYTSDKLFKVRKKQILL